MKKYIIGGLALVALVLFGVFNLKKSVTPYVGFDEAKTANTVVQVYGKLVKGTQSFDAKSGTLKFTIADTKGQTMNAEYAGAAPANFETADGMVLFGKCESGVFKATELFVKCPSKYKKKLAQSEAQ